MKGVKNIVIFTATAQGPMLGRIVTNDRETLALVAAAAALDYPSIIVLRRASLDCPCNFVQLGKFMGN